MLLTESEKAKKVRSLILDFVITTINEKTGGGTKYINRIDVHYLPAAITEENYRKNLTSAINQYVDGHPTYKYSQITDFSYKAVFKENAKEYREVLRLDSKDNVRHTLYSEFYWSSLLLKMVWGLLSVNDSRKMAVENLLLMR